MTPGERNLEHREIVDAVDRWLPEVMAYLRDRADVDQPRPGSRVTNEAGVLLVEAEHLAARIKAVRG